MKVLYKEWIRPFNMVEGTVVAEFPDKDQRKLKKYEIKPDAPTKDFTGNVFRFHPRMVTDKVTGLLVPDPDIEDVFEFIN